MLTKAKVDPNGTFSDEIVKLIVVKNCLSRRWQAVLFTIVKNSRPKLPLYKRCE